MTADTMADALTKVVPRHTVFRDFLPPSIWSIHWMEMLTVQHIIAVSLISNSNQQRTYQWYGSSRSRTTEQAKKKGNEISFSV